MVKVQFYDQVEDQELRFAVIITKADGRWVFCKHKQRDTLEILGGHREPGEDILTTAKRELYEETGAVKKAKTEYCCHRKRYICVGDGREEHLYKCGKHNVLLFYFGHTYFHTAVFAFAVYRNK